MLFTFATWLSTFFGLVENRSSNPAQRMNETVNKHFGPHNTLVYCSFLSFLFFAFFEFWPTVLLFLLVMCLGCSCFVFILHRPATRIFKQFALNELVQCSPTRFPGTLVFIWIPLRVFQNLKNMCQAAF